MRAALGRVPAWAWALAFALALCLPRLGASGFWDPSELKLAEQARDIARSDSLFDPTVAGKFPARPPLDLSLAALGIRLFGASELGRPPLLRALRRRRADGDLLGRRRPAPQRAGLLATLALGTMPLFVLEARQLTSDAPLIAALALVLGALGRYAWPPDGRRRGRDLLLGVAGLVDRRAGRRRDVGRGAAAPVAGGGALASGMGWSPATPPPSRTEPPPCRRQAGIGPDVAAERPFGASTWRPARAGSGRSRS